MRCRHPRSLVSINQAHHLTSHPAAANKREQLAEWLARREALHTIPEPQASGRVMGCPRPASEAAAQQCGVAAEPRNLTTQPAHRQVPAHARLINDAARPSRTPPQQLQGGAQCRMRASSQLWPSHLGFGPCTLRPRPRARTNEHHLAGSCASSQMYHGSESQATFARNLHSPCWDWLCL